MTDGLTNLLPPERRHALVREYRYRFGVVVISLLVSLVLAAAVLLIPTYIFLQGSIAAKETRLTAVQASLSSAGQTSPSARLAALSNDIATLTKLASGSSVSAVMRTVLAIPRSGVTLSGLTYTPVSGMTPATLDLSGVATTRAALSSYQLALQGAPFARAVNLPVSAYAKDTNIGFTITVLLAP